MKVLVIENEQAISSFIKRGLEAELCVVEVALNGVQGISFAQFNTYDVIILEFHLPDMSASDISVAIRKYKPSVPILVLSVEASIDIKISMLAVCDDYMTKPFSLRELIMRLKVLNRRGAIIYNNILNSGGIMLDSLRYIVTLNGKKIFLRNKEFSLLEYLMRHEGMVISRETMLEHIWDTNTDPFTNTVDTHIRLLRKKLQNKRRTFIRTIPKRGYCFSSGNA